MNILELYDTFLYSSSCVKVKKLKNIKTLLEKYGYNNVIHIDNMLFSEACKCTHYSFILYSINEQIKTILYFPYRAKIIKVTTNKYVATCICSPIEEVLPINLFLNPWYSEMDAIKSSNYKIKLLQ